MKLPVSLKRIESCLATVEAIASSSSVNEFLVGYTRQSAGQKGDAYRRLDFKHFVILADKMTMSDGLRLENALQKRTMGDPQSPVHRKYHSEKRANGRS